MRRPFILALVVILVSGAIAYASVPRGSVTTSKIAFRAVTTPKINNGAVKTEKIANNAVRTAKIGRGQVTLGNAADNSLAGKLAGKYQVVSNTETANTTFTVAHGLGRTPVGFIVVNTDTATTVYDAGTAWTATNIFLRSSTANADITLLVF